MTLYPEMFMSKWHLAAVPLILIAWAGLLIGKYDRKTVLKSGVISSLFFYAAITLPIMAATHDEKKVEALMLGVLDRNYESALGRDPDNQHIVTAALGAFPDDGLYQIRIYAGNYSSERTFHGSLKVMLKDNSELVLKEYFFEDLVIKPGEKIQVEKSIYHAEFDKYSFQFSPKKE